MQPTVYSYPLNQSINAFTEFSATYNSDAEGSWYKVNSEGITLGEEEITKQINFNCLDFNDIVFNQTPCNKQYGEELSVTVKTLYQMYHIFDVDDNECKVAFNYNAIFSQPETIIFKEAVNDKNVTLSDYISKKEWSFENEIHFNGSAIFNGDESIYVNESTSLSSYIAKVMGELVKFQFADPDKDGYPAVTDPEKNVIYLVKDSSSTETQNYYNEWIWIKHEDNVMRWEKIGSTKVNLNGALKKDENNTLPNYGESEYTNKPGVMFNNVFYSFEGLEYDDSGKQKFIKIDGNNRMPYITGIGKKPGIEFDGIFYSFDGLAKKEYDGPKFKADDSEIIPDANGFLIYTTGEKQSVTIKPLYDSYIILDAAVLDENSHVWSEINSISKDGSQVVVDFNDVTNGKSWLYIKTIYIENNSDPNIYDSVIFLRENEKIPVPAQEHRNVEFEYAYGPNTYKQVNKDVIELNGSYNELKVKTSYYAILDAHLVSTNGLTALKGISRSENKDIVYMNVNSTANGTDYLALKLLFFVNETDNKGAYVTDRVIRITKSN